MKDIRINILAGCLIGIVLFSACSVTKHLPEDEILYTGGKTVIVNKSSTRVGETALTEINAALAKTPSTTLLGGFLPIPFKMWMYNDFVKYKKGFGKWMFNRFAANPPVFISTVNPEVRVKVATNLLRDYGYFNGKVTYETLVDKKDSLKASLLYTVDMKNPYFIDTVYYQRFTPQTLKIMERGRRMSYITPGEQFNVVDLDEERSRISTLLRNRGYFYFRPDYMPPAVFSRCMATVRYNLGSRRTYQSSSDSSSGITGCRSTFLLCRRCFGLSLRKEWRGT